jgi:transposase
MAKTVGPLPSARQTLDVNLAVSLAVPGRPYTRAPTQIFACPSLDTCPDCGIDLNRQPVISKVKRLIFDLPPIKLQVTEYQATCKFCPNCRSRVTAEFPENVIATAQYGPVIQVAMAYLNVHQVIPCARTAEICEDLFNHHPSSGSIV